MNQYVTVTSVYALTLDANEDAKEKFYSSLDQVLSGVPVTDQLIFLSDFNVRVRQDSKLWNRIIGKKGVRKINSDGILLLTKCAVHELVVTNTLFCQ